LYKGEKYFLLGVILLQAKSRITLAALAGVPLIMVLGNSMLIPVLPQMKSALDISQFKVSLVITLFSVGISHSHCRLFI